MSDLNDFLPDTKTYNINTLTSHGSTNNASPTALSLTGYDMILFNQGFYGNVTYYSLPDGTKVGQEILIAGGGSGGSSPQIALTGAGFTSTYIVKDGSKNFGLIWNGSAWVHTNRQS